MAEALPGAQLSVQSVTPHISTHAICQQGRRSEERGARVRVYCPVVRVAYWHVLRVSVGRSMVLVPLVFDENVSGRRRNRRAAGARFDGPCPNGRGGVPASTEASPRDGKPLTTIKIIASNALQISARAPFLDYQPHHSPTSNLRPYCTRLVCFNAFIITFAAGDNSRSDRVMIPNASIWHGISSGNTVTIPCAA